MKKLLIIAITVLLSPGMKAQTHASNSASGSPTPIAADSNVLHKGSIVHAELSKSLDAGKVKVGGPVMAVVDPHPEAYGAVAGAKLMGHISEVQPHTSEKSESRLVIVFDKAVLQDGREIPFNVVIAGLRAGTHPPAAAPRKVQTMQESGPSAFDRAAGPMTGAPESKPEYITHRPETVLEMQADNARLNQQSGSALQGIYLKNDPSGSTLMCPAHNVKLEKGTTLMLKIIAAVQ